MQFTLYSCFVTHSESVAIAAVLVLVFECLVLDRPQPSITPASLQHQSSRSDPLRPFPHHQYSLSLPISLQIYTLQQKSSILPYKSRTYGRIYLVISSVTVKRKGKERKNSTRLVLNLPGAVDGLVLLACLLGWGGVFGGILFIDYLNYLLDSGFLEIKKSRMDVFFVGFVVFFCGG